MSIIPELCEQGNVSDKCVSCVGWYDCLRILRSGLFVVENSVSLLCRLEYGVIHNFFLAMIMFHFDPLIRCVTEIIDRVFEVYLYNYWIYLNMKIFNLHSRKIVTINPLDGYYSVKLYHMQPAFYLLLLGLCLSAFCFMLELSFNRY